MRLDSVPMILAFFSGDTCIHVGGVELQTLAVEFVVETCNLSWGWWRLVHHWCSRTAGSWVAYFMSSVVLQTTRTFWNEALFSEGGFLCRDPGDQSVSQGDVYLTLEVTLQGFSLKPNFEIITIVDHRMKLFPVGQLELG